MQAVGPIVKNAEIFLRMGVEGIQHFSEDVQHRRITSSIRQVKDYKTLWVVNNKPAYLFLFSKK